MGKSVKDIIITNKGIWVQLENNIVKIPNKEKITKSDVTCTCEGNVFKKSYCKHKSVAIKSMGVKLIG